MTPTEWVAFGALCVIALLLVSWLASPLIRRRPMSRKPASAAERADADRRVEQIKQATQPGDLDRPNVRAGSTWMGD